MRLANSPQSLSRLGTYVFMVLGLFLGGLPMVWAKPLPEPRPLDVVDPQASSSPTQTSPSLIIDDFSVNQDFLVLQSPHDAGRSAETSELGQGILGNERDLAITLEAGGEGRNGVRAGVAAGAFSYGQDPTVAAHSLLQWDGQDGSITLDHQGLGGVDLTGNGSQDALLLRGLFADFPIRLQVTLYADSANASMSEVILSRSQYEAFDIVLPFSTFTPVSGTGAFASSVGAIELFLSGLGAADFVLDGIATTSTLMASKTASLWEDGNADGTANPGETLRYVVVLANQDDLGDAPVSGVIFHDVPDEHTRLLPGTVMTTQGTVTIGNGGQDSKVQVNMGEIADSETVTITFDVKINAEIAAGISEIVNQGVASSWQGALVFTDDPAEPGDADPTRTRLVTAPDITLTKTDARSEAMPGESLVYTITVGNRGGQSVSNVSVTEIIPAHTTFLATKSSDGWDCAPSGQPGDTCTYNIDLLPADAGAGQRVLFALKVDEILPVGIDNVENSACISWSGSGDTPAVTPCAMDQTAIRAAPDLVLDKGDGDIVVIPDQLLVYSLVYENRGNQAASGVFVTETLPANTTFVPEASSLGWTCWPDDGSGRTCEYPLGDLQAGERGIAAVAVRVDETVPAGITELSNVACIGDDGSNGGDTNVDNNCDGERTPLEAAPDLTLVLDVGSPAAAPGTLRRLALAYANKGNQDATGVVLSIEIPAYTTYAKDDNIFAWQCLPGNGDSIVCTYSLGSLPAGAEGEVTFFSRIAPSLPAGIWQMQHLACIRDDANNGSDLNTNDNCASKKTLLEAAPDLRIVKDDRGALAQRGEKLVYALGFENQGTQDATGVVITDVVPANMIFLASDNAQEWSCAQGGNTGSVCTYVVGAVAVGALDAVSLVLRVRADTSPGVTHLQNRAWIRDDGDNGIDLNQADNSDDEITALGPMAGTPTPGTTYYLPMFLAGKVPAQPTRTATPTQTPVLYQDYLPIYLLRFPLPTPTPRPTATPTAKPTPATYYLPLYWGPRPLPTPTSRPTKTPTPPLQPIRITIPDARWVNGIAVNERTNKIFVVSRDNDALFVVDGASLQTEKRLDVCADPFGVDVNSLTNKVYVACFSSDNLAVINGVTMNVTRILHVGSEPTFVAVSEKTNRIYVVTHGQNRLVEVMGDTDQVGRVASTDPGAFSLAVNERLHRVYVANRDAGTVVTIDATTMSELKDQKLVLGNRAIPFGLGFDEDARRLYITYTDRGSLTQLGVYTAATSGLMPVTTVTVPEGGRDAAGRVGVNDRHHHVFVLNTQSNIISVVDGGTGQILDSVLAVIDPHDIDTDASRDRMYVTSRKQNEIWMIPDIY